MSDKISQRLAALESLVAEQQETIEHLREQLEADTGEPGPHSRSSRQQNLSPSSIYKILGELDAPDGAGVLGRNTADSGTPVGIEGSVPNAEGYGLSTPDHARVGGAIESGQFRNMVGDAQLQAAFDGLVVPVGPGLGMDDAIDPATTDTPIQDAIDAIDETGWYTPEWSPGAVLLPAGRIEEAGALTHTLTKTFLGWGIHATEVRFPDLETPAIEQVEIPNWPGDCMRTYWDGIRFHGVDGANRTGSAIHLDETLIRGFNVGRVSFQEWNDVIYHDGASWFESHWDWFTSENIYGRCLVAEDTQLGGSAWTLDKFNCYRDNGAGRVIDARNAKGGNLMVRDLHIQVNADGTNGGTGPPAIDMAAPTTGFFRIDNLHYETTVGLDLPAVVRLADAAHYRLDTVDILGPNDADGESLVVDSIVKLDSVGQVEIGQHTKTPDATTIEESFLTVGGSPLPGVVRFHGRSEQVTETYGSTAGKIWALEDMRVVDPFHKAVVTHTSGGPTEVDGINQGMVGGRETFRNVTPRLQRLDPVTMPDADFSIEHRFEWRGSGDYERWVLILEWAEDPGVDIELELEVSTRGPG